MISSCALLSPPQEEGEERDGEGVGDPGVLAVLLLPPTPTSTTPFPVLLKIILLLLLFVLMLLCFLSTPIVRMRASPGAAEGGTGRWTTWRAFRRRALLFGAGEERTVSEGLSLDHARLSRKPSLRSSMWTPRDMDAPGIRVRCKTAPVRPLLPRRRPCNPAAVAER